MIEELKKQIEVLKEYGIRDVVEALEALLPYEPERGDVFVTDLGSIYYMDCRGRFTYMGRAGMGGNGEQKPEPVQVPKHRERMSLWVLIKADYENKGVVLTVAQIGLVLGIVVLALGAFSAMILLLTVLGPLAKAHSTAAWSLLGLLLALGAGAFVRAWYQNARRRYDV